jgi:late competence protein required for DNA uptake (superfamily II DNA/RNA helicase)
MKFNKDNITEKLKKKEELTEKELKYALENIRKRCARCDKNKLLQEFNIQKAGKYGRNGCCRKCVAIRYQKSLGEQVLIKNKKIKRLLKKIKELEEKLEENNLI